MSVNDFDAVIFDMGGTLLDYDPVPADEMRVIRTNKITEFLNSRGYNFSTDEIEDSLVAPYHALNFIECEKNLHEVDLCGCIKDGLKRLGVAEDYSLWLISLIHEILKDNLIVYKDSLETLEKLSRKYLLGLISNTTIPGIYFARDLNEIGMSRYFKHMLFTADWGFRKPHSSVFHRMLELLKVEAHRALYVGDSFKNDVFGPASIGMKTAWINPESKSVPAAYRQIKPDFTLKTLGDLSLVLL